MSLLNYMKVRPSLNTQLACYSLLIKLEGLNVTVLDNFCQLVIGASKKKNLEITKRINLTPTDFKDNQMLARPLDSYEKHRATFHLNKTGRISLFFRFNLTAEHFSEEPTKPSAQHRKLCKTFHFNKKGRIIQVAKIPFEETHTLIKCLRDNVPSGVSLDMELVNEENEGIIFNHLG
ncbi:uncharacterized protein [Montipora capricornis]|uniref:uncharacterized protein isoform X5 n=1 Tax=Montipora capricornis TaxID=246305 RepID=UPI0035F11AE2